MFFLVLLLAPKSQAQRSVMYLQHQPLLNPSAMGEIQSLSIALSGQYALVGFDGAPKSVNLQVTVPFASQVKDYSRNSYRNKRGGRSNYRVGNSEEMQKPHFIGVNIQAFEVGAHKSIVGLLVYAYKVKLWDKIFLSLAFSGGADFLYSNYRGTLDEDIQVNDPLLIGVNSRADFAFDLGTYLRYEGWFLSVFMAQKDNTQNINYHAGWNSRKETGWNIAVSTLGSYTTNKQYTQDISLMLIKGGFSFGTLYRTQKDIAALVGIKLASINIGYAYQLYHLDARLPTHEIMLKYTLNQQKEKQ
ncbi:MAG: type IX secretion system membrane protein PorP/SprF [Bacteroidales bacterium]